MNFINTKTPDPSKKGGGALCHGAGGSGTDIGSDSETETERVKLRKLGSIGGNNNVDSEPRFSGKNTYKFPFCNHNAICTYGIYVVVTGRKGIS